MSASDLYGERPPGHRPAPLGRTRRERYVGERLPEPLLTDPSPAERAETADSLSLAFLVLLKIQTIHFPSPADPARRLAAPARGGPAGSRSMQP